MAVAMIALQILDRIEFIHNKSILHRDIKPDNFLIGTGRKKHRIYIIDFGLSKKYIKDETHTEYKKGRSFTGSFRYSSIRNHKGIEQSRRDDIEGLGYVLMYFNRGSLPWQGLKAATKKQKYERIMETKMSTPPEALCNGFPAQFIEYISHAKSLRFDQQPNYNYLRKTFRTLAVEMGYTYDYQFDWTKMESKCFSQIIIVWLLIKAERFGMTYILNKLSRKTITQCFRRC
jgi:serine/threonine protein kinase